MDDELMEIIGVFGMAGVVGIGAFAMFGGFDKKEPTQEKPRFVERAYVVPDFNRDGIEDLVIESEKGRVTYLGKLENGSIVYYRDAREVK